MGMNRTRTRQFASTEEAKAAGFSYFLGIHGEGAGWYSDQPPVDIKRFTESGHKVPFPQSQE